MNLYLLAVSFFGCSEAQHKQDYGCDEEDQDMDVPDRNNKNVQVTFILNWLGHHVYLLYVYNMVFYVNV